LVQRLSPEVLTIGIIIYVGILVTITYIAYNRRKATFEDFFAASREENVWSLTLHISATIFSSFILIGTLGFGYTFGYSAIILLGFGALYPLFHYMIGRKVWVLGKKYGFYTPTDILSERYESKFLGAFIAIALIIWMIPFVVIQFIGASYAFIAASGGSLPLGYAVVLFAFLTMAYVSAGGQRVVIWTDTFQGALLIFVLIGTLSFIVHKVGGFTAAASTLTDQFPRHLTARGGLGIWSYGTFFSWAVLFGLMNIGQPQIFRSFYYAKNVDTLKKSAIIQIPVFMFIISTAVLIGVFGRVMWPDLGTIPLFNKPDDLLPAMMVYLVPGWFGVMILFGITAATMSTIDSIFTGFGAMLQKDIFFFIKKPKNGQQNVLIGRLFIVLVTVIICVFALRDFRSLVVVAVAGWGGVLQVVPTIIGGMTWKRGNKYGAAAGTILGMSLYIILEFIIKFKAPYDISNAVIAFLLNVLVYTGVSLATKAPSEQTINKFFFSSEQTLELSEGVHISGI
jgi:solute:Na+ symporter, SSS family